MTYRGSGNNDISEKMAHKIYDIALGEIEKDIGIDATFQFDLERVANELIGDDDFAGVFAVDELVFPNGTKYAIFNLDKSFQSGSHWMGIFKHKNGDLDVYDSFGRKSIEIAESLFRKGIKIFDSDRDEEQAVKESNCGQRATAWIYVHKYFGRKTAMKI